MVETSETTTPPIDESSTSPNQRERRRLVASKEERGGKLESLFQRIDSLTEAVEQQDPEATRQVLEAELSLLAERWGYDSVGQMEERLDVDKSLGTSLGGVDRAGLAKAGTNVGDRVFYARNTSAYGYCR